MMTPSMSVQNTTKKWLLFILRVSFDFFQLQISKSGIEAETHWVLFVAKHKLAFLQ